LKNNKLDAVIVSAEEYENMIDLLEDSEMQRNAKNLKNKYKKSADS
jgi:PHD/YefM family antitoxin component YafN of YafNO toxin-antitoxin module